MKLMTLAVIAVSIIFITVDFFGRFLGADKDIRNTQQSSEILTQLSLPQLSSEQFGQLEQAFVSFEEEAPEPVAKLEGLSELQQQQQQGELTEFYAGDLRYRLLAIIYPQGDEQALKKPLALLKVTNIKTPNALSIEQIYHGDTFANLTVSITSTKKISLIKGPRQIELLMYQPRA
jgi:hypothetical protein